MRRWGEKAFQTMKCRASGVESCSFPGSRLKSDRSRTLKNSLSSGFWIPQSLHAQIIFLVDGFWFSENMQMYRQQREVMFCQGRQVTYSLLGLGLSIFNGRKGKAQGWVTSGSVWGEVVATK